MASVTEVHTKLPYGKNQVSRQSLGRKTLKWKEEDVGNQKEDGKLV